MIHRKSWAIALTCAFAALAGCGGGRGGGPAGPSEEPPDGLTIVSARAKLPLAGVTLTVEDLGTFTTDGSGTVQLPETADGRTVTIVAPGYTGPRKFTYRRGMTDHLLPDDAKLSQAWLMSAYYAINPNARLIRAEPGALSVQPADDLRSEQALWDAFSWGVARINGAQHSVQFDVAPEGQAGSIRVYQDPNDPILLRPEYKNAWAITVWDFRGYTVVGGRIVFRHYIYADNPLTKTLLRQAVAHEFGHMLGIPGHPPGGIMGSGELLPDFSSQEKEAMEYLFLRKPGTRPTDDSTDSVTAMDDGGITSKVVCVLRL